MTAETDAIPIALKVGHAGLEVDRTVSAGSASGALVVRFAGRVAPNHPTNAR